MIIKRFSDNILEPVEKVEEYLGNTPVLGSATKRSRRKLKYILDPVKNIIS